MTKSEMLNSMTGSMQAPRSWLAPGTYLSDLLRDPWYRAIFELLSEASAATHMFFGKENIRGALVPLTTGSISSPMGKGSDSLPVKVAFGERQVFLADSMQFYLELALRISPPAVYYLMPSFRGEVSDQRHLNQFFHTEVELMGGLDEIMGFAERYIVHLCNHFLNQKPDLLKMIAGNLKHIESVLERRSRFEEITFSRAVQELSALDGAFSTLASGEKIITGVGERQLTAWYGDFVWLTHMPRETVPFYQAVDPHNERASLSADLLAGQGELLGAGARAVSGKDVMNNLHHSEVDPAPYKWYIEMKDRAPIQTAGFGLGVERFLMWATKTTDIRDWALLPRDQTGHGPI